MVGDGGKEVARGKQSSELLPAVQVLSTLETSASVLCLPERRRDLARARYPVNCSDLLEVAFAAPILPSEGPAIHDKIVWAWFGSG